MLAQPQPWMRSQVLHHEEIALVVRADHPRGDGPLSLAELASMTHVKLRGTDFFRRISGQRSGGALDTMEVVEMAVALAQERLEARVGIVVPDTISALEVVRQTDMICLCPRRVAERHGGADIRILDLPYAAQPSPMRMIWNLRQDRDAGLLWLRDIIAEACRELQTAGR